MRKKYLLALLILLLVGLVSWAGRIVYSGKEKPVVKDYVSWSEDVIKEASGIPVKNGDRIKPLSTYAKVLMLQLHGDHFLSFQDEDGKSYRVGPEGFLLDALLRPQYSKEMKIFQVENAEILTAVGVETKKASDHYSYNTLSPAIPQLFKLASEYEEEKKAGGELEITESQTLSLARNVRDYQLLLTYFNFARAGVVLPVIPGSAPDAKPKFVPTSTFMSAAGEIHKVISAHNKDGKEIPSHLVPILEQVLNHANDAKYGPVLLNNRGADKPWRSAGDGIISVFQATDPDPGPTIKDILALEGLYNAAADKKIIQEEKKSRFGKKTVRDVQTLSSIGTFKADLQENLQIQERKDLRREISYNKANWFFNAIFLCFLPAMVLVILSWLNPTSMFGRWMGWGTALFSTLGLLFTIIGLTQRSLIMHRPPVGNLYDTIIFIAAGVVLIALLTELLTRRKLALGVAPFVGFFLLVLSWIYEREEAVDNLEPLIAVLRSNFWLTVHVPTITFGYAAGLAAWLFGCVYVFARVLGLDKEDPTLRRLISRMTYGSICFTLLLSLIGTVLGGIWANDSWGRFWGWDPKENGALMIVLWTLFILHARLGGILKEWGIHLAAIVTGPIVVFSWWHTNLLGVGLHSYGFSDSKMDAVNLFYLVNLLILAIGVMAAILQSGKKRPLDN